MLCRDMMEPYIARKPAEERNSLSNKHWHASDNKPLHQACAQKFLDRDSSVDIDMLDAARGQLCDDLGRSSGHLLYRALSSSHRRKVKRVAAQHYNALVAIGPI